MLSFVALILFLQTCGIDYGRYRQATQLLDFLLGMSVVALGYLMYEQIDRLRGPGAARAELRSPLDAPSAC